MNIFTFVIVAVIISVVSSFSVSKILKNVNKAASAAVLSGLIAVSPAHAVDVLEAEISKIVLPDLGGTEYDYPTGNYIHFDCPTYTGKSTVIIDKIIPTTWLTVAIFCSTNSIEIDNNIGTYGSSLPITVDTSVYSSQNFKFSYDLPTKTVTVTNVPP